MLSRASFRVFFKRTPKNVNPKNKQNNLTTLLGDALLNMYNKMAPQTPQPQIHIFPEFPGSILIQRCSSGAEAGANGVGIKPRSSDVIVRTFVGVLSEHWDEREIAIIIRGRLAYGLWSLQ